MFAAKLDRKLNQSKSDFQLREHSLLGGHSQVRFHHQGKFYLSFTTNNYLGLASHPKIVTACATALATFGVGSGSAYLMSGYTTAHRELEEALADFLGFPAVLLFSCGYMANLGVLNNLFGKNDLLLGDRLNHASLIDSCRATKANFKRYRHCDPQSLANLCQVAAPDLIVTEGVFSMDGTSAPLTSIVAIAKQYDSKLLLDDTHGIGVLGTHGKGAVEINGIPPTDVDIFTGSFGKAFGTYGGFAAGSKMIIDHIKQFARTYLYTTALPPVLAVASLTSLKLIQTENWRRDKLQELIHYFRKCADDLAMPLTPSVTPIQPIILGSNQKALKVSQLLYERGIIVKAIRPPTVPRNTARIRITLTALHEKRHIDYLMENLAYAINAS